MDASLVALDTEGGWLQTQIARTACKSEEDCMQCGRQRRPWTGSPYTLLQLQAYPQHSHSSWQITKKMYISSRTILISWWVRLQKCLNIGVKTNLLQMCNDTLTFVESWDIFKVYFCWQMQLLNYRSSPFIDSTVPNTVALYINIGPFKSVLLIYLSLTTFPVLLVNNNDEPIFINKLERHQ